MKKITGILFVTVLIVSFLTYLHFSREDFHNSNATNPSEQEEKRDNIALSVAAAQTQKHKGGYVHLKKYYENYKEMDEFSDTVYDVLVSIDGEELYRTKRDIIEYMPIGNEMYVWDFTINTYKCKLTAVNFETKEKRVIYNKAGMFTDLSNFVVNNDRAYHISEGKKCVLIESTLEGQVTNRVELKQKLVWPLLLGVMNERAFYIETVSGQSEIYSCNLDGTDSRIVAKGFKIRYGRIEREKGSYSGTLTYDDKGWYFLGGKKWPYRNVCKVDFKTGKAEVIKKNICGDSRYEAEYSFDVHGDYLYFKGKNNEYIYRENMKTGKVELVVEKQVGRIFISDEHLCYEVFPNKKGKDEVFILHKRKIAQNGELGEESEMSIEHKLAWMGF